MRNRHTNQWEEHTRQSIMKLVGDSHEELGATVSKDPVYVRIESPNCVDMQIVDLPGFRDFSIDTESKALAESIQTLVKEFKVRYTKDPKKIAKYGDSEHHVLDLKPRKKSPHYKGLLLSVHATTGRVDAFVVYNQDGSSNYFRLTNLKTNRGFTKSVFKFKVPTGYVESKE